ncbi:hypothetical protein Asphe3_01010 [Pseudarthrobacter phenanthrenivorans Sphe3]|uniref:Uncharacterized protein n=1 Tax=Pseudarthrobacter phenanthrenivorans (strain DSM 18606 / JCM 16027 / LMG 23796 / Sphe3) TaxID=930171 RepID=F0M5I8_PSEPM|nr:hypothetical protein Asphe3_01010 [Pseudarthrobacter phenanthrenivorans Sphe3]
MLDLGVIAVIELLLEQAAETVRLSASAGVTTK